MSKLTNADNATLHIDEQYKSFLVEIKNKVSNSRFRASLAVNNELILLYWHIGKRIIEKQAETVWGDKLIETLSKDLQTAFPETRGFSTRNIKYMRQFATAYHTEIGQQAVAQLPWGHILLLIQKVKNNNKREWYVAQTVANGWRRDILERYLKQDLFDAQAVHQNKASNFIKRLPSPQSELAQDLLKSPYNFDFMGLHDKALERDIEHASIKHVAKFLLELGRGFAFVGSQVPIVIDDEEFFIDILLYNLRLRAFTVVEFKSTKFKPAHVGQLNFYLSAVDDLMRHPDDSPSIGLLLCKSRNKVVAEYSLKNVEKPIGISEYQLTKALPKKLQNVMPSIEEIESELGNDTNKDK